MEENLTSVDSASIAAAAKLANFVHEMKRFDHPESVAGPCKSFSQPRNEDILKPPNRAAICNEQLHPPTIRPLRDNLLAALAD